MNRPIKVCLILEGTYPYITGGVSSWVHDIIVNLPEIEFVLYSISPVKDQPVNYQVPDNVVGHKDIILSEKPKKNKHVWGKKKILEKIQRLHQHHFSSVMKEFREVMQDIPDGYHLTHDAIESDIGWDMITHSNLKRNPVYPFADYFWAWKSSHDMIFKILSHNPPDADIYHAVSTGYAGLAAIIGKLRKNKPYLLTEHGLYHKEREMEIRKAPFIKGYQRDMWIRIYNNLSKMSYKHADLITALFEENRKKQIDLGAPPDKTVVIPNGIDIERFASVKREDRPGFHVGLVGRVVPIKDIKTFIAACKIVYDAIPEAEFHCIGPTDEDPAYYEDCKMLVQSLRIEDRFYFTGRQNVLEYYSFLDVLLLTSVREAQPLVILEAYSAGVPVVSTRVGNVAEMLDYDDRFLASSKDANKLAEGMIFLHNNPEERAAIIKRNKEKVPRFYKKEDLHKAYHNLYHSLAGRD